MTLFTEYGFFVYIILLTLFFSLALAKYGKKNHKFKPKKHAGIITILVYSIGTSLLVFGSTWLIRIIYLHFIGNGNEISDVYTLLATTLTSTGLSITIYFEQKLDSIFEKVELINELSAEIASKITENVTKQLSDDVTKLTNDVIKQASDNISLKIRPKPLRKEIAKQIVKSEKVNYFIKRKEK